MNGKYFPPLWLTCVRYICIVCFMIVLGECFGDSGVCHRCGRFYPCISSWIVLGAITTSILIHWGVQEIKNEDQP